PQYWLKHVTWEKIIHPEDLNTVLNYCGTATREKRNHSIEFRALRADGRVIWLRDTASVIVKGDEPVKLRGVLMDITERKQAEIEREKSLALFYSLIDNMESGVIVETDKRAVFVANRNFCRIFSIPVLPATLIGIDCSEAAEQSKSLLAEPEAFPLRIAEIIQERKRVLGEEICFADGRCFERDYLPIFSATNGFVGHMWQYREITGRRKAEKAIRESEKKYRTLFEESKDAVFMTTPDGEFLEVNPAGVELLGYSSREELLRVDVTRDLYLNPQDRLRYKDLLEQQGFVKDVELQLMRKDGKRIVVLETATVVRNETGDIAAYRGIIKDISDRKRAEQLQQALYRIAQAADGSTHLDDLFRAIHGIVKEIMPAENFYIALYDEKQDMISFPYFVDEVDQPSPPQRPGKGLTEYVLRTGESLLCDERIHGELMKRGEAELVGAISPIWLGVPLVIEQKTIGVMAVQHYSNPHAYGESEQQVLQFISSQIAKAIASKRFDEELQQSEERYRNLVESARDVIFTVSPQGFINSLNQAFENVTGWKREDWIGKSFTDLIHSEDLSKAIEAFSSTLKGEAIGNQEYRLRTRSGEYIIADLTSTCQIINGKVAGVLGIARDITARKQLEDHLRQAQKMESVGTLASGIAHDFNNILGIIMGYSSLLENQQANQLLLAKSAAAITRAVQRGALLVRQILTLARKTEVSPRPVNPSEAVQELVKMIKETFPKTIEIVQNLDPSVPQIMIDSTQLLQCLLNLSVNARDAMGANGILTFTTSVIPGAELRRFPNVTRDRYVSMRITDTGAGIDEQTVGRIFEPFFTTKELGKGTGMGLAMVYGIVQSHNGFVDVKSKVGHGTTFSLYFPALQSGKEHSDHGEHEAVELPRLVGGTETLLVVEDEELLLDLVKTFLENGGFKVLVARDGHEAVELYKNHQHNIDLVLSDLGLPGMNGVDLIRGLQELNPRVRVVVASGYLSPVVRSEFLQRGLEEFVDKPYRPDEVIKTIRRVLDSTPVAVRQG
ncbi:MAG: PAS domain S-box protein, partial [Bacteroidota bacterium]